MKIIKFSLKNLIFSFLAFTIFFLLIELIFRLMFFGISGSSLSFLYGINSDIKIRKSANNFIEFYKIEHYDLFDNSLELDNKNNNVFFCFGGSTTAGYNCGNSSSSWPNELNKLSKGGKYVNLGKNGTSSDYSYNIFS